MTIFFGYKLLEHLNQLILPYMALLQATTPIASSNKPWVLDSRAFTHITGIKEKFHSFSFLDNIPHLYSTHDIIESTCGGHVFTLKVHRVLTGLNKRSIAIQVSEQEVQAPVSKQEAEMM